MTMTVNSWLPVFTRPDTAEILLDSWRYLREYHDFRLHGYVVLENHLHLIAGSPRIGKDVQRFKSYTARRIIDHLKSANARRLLEIHYNPVKRGFVDLPEHWRWSSARNYSGSEGPVKVDRDW